MEATVLTVGGDALWSLTVIAAVVGPPALLVTVAAWVARRVVGRRAVRLTGMPARPAASRAARGS